MARAPAELLTRLRDEEQRLVDRVEAELDRVLDRDYEGGVYTHHVYENLNLRVQKELKKRYCGWYIEFDVKSRTERNETVWTTVMRMQPLAEVPF